MEFESSYNKRNDFINEEVSISNENHKDSVQVSVEDHIFEEEEMTLLEEEGDPFYGGEECTCGIKIVENCKYLVNIEDVITKRAPHQCNITYEGIIFGKGYITDESMIITPIIDKQNFSRIGFTMRIPYIIEYKDAKEKVDNLTGFVEDTINDIALFMPKVSDKPEYNILIETHSVLSKAPVVVNNSLKFSVKVYILINVLGELHLSAPCVKCDE